LFEIRESKVEEVVPKIKAIMENVIDPAKTKGVKCVVEYAVGKNWSEI
jgi:DNA polymerase I-like protein with 3'-5' exonuclease and polymerase domains